MRRSNPILMASAGLALVLTLAGAAQAGELRDGGKLALTGGVSNLEGAGGGGLATWALITGGATRDGVGANLHATLVQLPDYQLRSAGAAVGLFDRLEMSYAHQDFDTGGTGAKLGLGRGFTFRQDVVGAKLRLAGDAVYDQDSWVPQVAAGVQWKRAASPVVTALGAQSRTGLDVYVAATKILLDQSLVLDGTVRATKANQFGILGFGGPGKDRYTLQVEGSAALLLSPKLAVGAEVRTRPDNLALKEDDAYDLFAAYALNKSISVTAAYVDLGEIATFRGQRGLYLSIQTGF